MNNLLVADSVSKNFGAFKEGLKSYFFKTTFPNKQFLLICCFTLMPYIHELNLLCLDIDCLFIMYIWCFMHFIKKYIIENINCAKYVEKQTDINKRKDYNLKITNSTN